MVYLLSFAVTYLSISLSKKFDESNDKKIIKNSKVFLLFSVVILSLVVALRSPEIGTDTETYLKLFNSSFEVLINQEKLEPLFAIHVALTKLVFGNFNMFLFISHFYIYFFLIYGLKRLDAPLSISILLYLFFYFNMSLNAIRQLLSISIVVLFMKDLHDKKYVKFSVGSILSYLIHRTSIIAIFLIVLRMVFTLSKKKRKVVLISLLFLSLLSVVFAVPILKIIADSGLIPERYIGYFTLNTTENRFIISSLVRIPVLIIYIFDYFYKQYRDKSTSDSYLFYIIIGFYEILLLNLELAIPFGGRLSYLYGVLTVTLLYPRLIETQLFKNKRLKELLLIIAGFSYWGYSIYYRGFHETVPYQSNVINVNVLLSLLLILMIVLICMNYRVAKMREKN